MQAALPAALFKPGGTVIAGLMAKKDESELALMKPTETPGEYPYTRGIYPIHYQYQPWMDLQIIGYGLPHQTRERMDLLLQEEIGRAHV